MASTFDGEPMDIPVISSDWYALGDSQMVENLLKMYINSTDITEMERIQLDDGCCGVYTYTDWRNTPWYKDNEGSSLLAPPSCCAMDDVIVNCTAGAGNIFSKSAGREIPFEKCH